MNDATRTRAACLVGLLLCSSSVARGDETSAAGETSAPSPVIESLESMGSLPWYDAESGQVAPVDVSPRVDDSVNRNSRWLPQPKKAANPTSRATPSSNTTTAQVTTGQSFAELVGWAILGALMTLVIGLLVYAFMRIEATETGVAGTATDPEEPEEEFQARLENLPVDVRRPAGNLLEEADRLAASGHFDSAIIYLFGHRLLQLDRHHMIRLARGKTNRQYLAELRGRGELRAILRDTVQVFELSYFGRYDISPERFQEIRAAQPQFEALLSHLREAA